jgi:hypothetical protein
MGGGREETKEEETEEDLLIRTTIIHIRFAPRPGVGIKFIDPMNHTHREDP